MNGAKPIPLALLEWAHHIVGTVHAVRDVSHDRPDSRVWRLTCDAALAFVKVSPNPKAFCRETRALREVAPCLELGTGPLLLAASAHEQALLLSSVPGRPVRSLALAPAEQRSLHRQAGNWLRRFHGTTGDLTAQHHVDATAQSARAAAGADEHLQCAGGLISARQQRAVRWHAAELGRLGPLPAGYIHGDFQELH